MMNKMITRDLVIIKYSNICANYMSVYLYINICAPYTYVFIDVRIKGGLVDDINEDFVGCISKVINWVQEILLTKRKRK